MNFRALLSLAVLGVVACGGGTASAPAPATAPDAWAGLASPRPAVLDGAPRVTVTEATVALDPWGMEAGVASQALAELVVAGLLERRDIHFVERRRFSQAAEYERRGAPRPPGQPPAGTSPGAEFQFRVALAPAAAGLSILDLVLVEVQTGAVREAWRIDVPPGGEPVGVARLAIAALAKKLSDLRIAAPGSSAPAPNYQSSGVPIGAVSSFVAGVRAGDAWEWDEARVAYQRAIREGGGAFDEAGIALRRAARLRAGGTLGGS